MRHIYQHKDWPEFRWDSAELAAELEWRGIAIRQVAWHRLDGRAR